MSLLFQIVDVQQSPVNGAARVNLRVTHKDASQTVAVWEHTGPSLFPLAADPTWQTADISIEHADYAPHTLIIRWDSTGVISWSDPCTQSTTQGGDRIFTIPLSRIRHAPGQIPPYGNPTGAEKGVYVQQMEGQPQMYGGHLFNLLPVQRLRLLKDWVPNNALLPSCILNPHNDDGWQRLSYDETAEVDAANHGGFVWLEYGSTASRPQQPRFLIAVWVPLPSEAIKDGKLDMLVFFSPSTDTNSYPPSSYPFRDKYPYSAIIDKQTGEKYDAKIQPYVHLGYKYLFRPTLMVPMSIASGKPLILVMPIFPNASGKGKQGNRHMWQPFNSKAGMYRLLIEIRQFLEREGYNGSSFGFHRFNGKIAPTAGNAPPPPPAFASVNRTRLEIRNIIVSGFSSASLALEPLFRTDSISASTTDFPPELFGAAPSEFDKRWQEFWDLDFDLNEKKTGISRSQYETALRQWLTRDTRRVRLYHGGWTLDMQPDAFFPKLRKLLLSSPRMLMDATIPSRWSADWRDPAAHWSALFFSGAFLRAMYTDQVLPTFPLGDAAGTKGDYRSAIHAFTAQLGFGHASCLRKTP